MQNTLRIANSLPFFWLLLAIPAVLLVVGFARGDIIAMDMLHPTGEWSARLLVVALALSPLQAIFGSRGWTRWLVRRRRSLGVAAFGYAALHLVFYAIDLGLLAAIIDELTIMSIWTGWLALLAMLPLALTSNDPAMRALGRGWKRLQRLAYPAAVFTFVHWVLIHDGAMGALVWFGPLAALQLLRIIINYRKTSNRNGRVNPDEPLSAPR